MASTLHDPAYREFVVELVRLRTASGITQAELALRLGKPQSFVSKSERFERRIDPGEFRSMVVALGGDPTMAFQAVHARLVDQAIGA